MIAVLLLNVYVTAPLTAAAERVGDRLPRFVTADAFRPIVNPAYDEIVQLVTYLHSQAQPGDHILVAASSVTLNYSLLDNAEAVLHDQSRQPLYFDPAPQLDSMNMLPLKELTGARFVVVARPFQHHRPADQQRVVHVLLDAFDRSWRIADDFTLLPARFTLNQPGSEVLIYERTRSSSPEVVRDTAEHMSEYMRR
jgi:hypothetical protein